MAYQALYRKWRPLKFDDVIGQTHITDTIKNEIVNSRLAHAYLFTGTRGTGKTTTAKILSRAVNCLSPIDGNPCNECEVCRAILSDTCLDVQEIDAASNTGVDNIRDIISQVNYVATVGKYKVYIIDEVHMLSKGAFNALLKTLEEPPAHIIFILATTEIQQIPATILSRCQRFDFKTISVTDIVSNIAKILDNENIFATEDALEYVAYLGDGSMRDSLSILDQCLAFSDGELTLEKVVDVVGAVDDKILYEFARDISANDTVSALRRFNKCIEDGKNIDNIAKGILGVLREIILYKVSPDSFKVSKIKLSYLEKIADGFDVPTLVESINKLTECIASFSSFSSPRVLCECALIRLTTPSMNTDVQSMAARISAIENKLSNLSKLSLTPVSSEAQSEGTCTVETAEKEETHIETNNPFEPDIQNSECTEDKFSQETHIPVQSAPTLEITGADKAVGAWSSITKKLATSGKITLCALLFGAKVKASGQVLNICVSNSENRRTLSEQANREIIQKIVSQEVGSKVKINITDDEISVSEEVTNDDLFENLGSIEKKFPDNFNLN